MSNIVRLHVGGDYACFTRPEMKAERVSYDVLTPSAARGILEAIHWKPAIFWVVDKIHVLNPICFESIKRNELGSKISYRNAAQSIRNHHLDNLCTHIEDDRQQRYSMVLKNVSYIIEAHVRLTDRLGPDDNIKKHLEIFKRRAMKGQCFHQPCLGMREFPAWFNWLDEDSVWPISNLSAQEANQDLGWMLHDIDFANDATPHFYHAKLQNGIINVPSGWVDGDLT
ncbi:type I-C CRISPR-associated protein Cas5c [Neisseriaceae bacterium ESL0693]|nr:type I-C CRISPR-associated protein Cas5c [Neisseriaceae bacterium ESL0693]